MFSLFNKDPESNAAAVDRLVLDTDDSFIDLGCGLGAAMEHAVTTGAATAGIDPSESMVERALIRVPQAEVRVGSAEAIPFEDGRFTAALAASTYHHWADPDAGLTEVLRVLAPGGVLLVVEKKLKRGTGHGLDRADADRLGQSLLGHGFASSEVDTMKAGRKEYLAVTAIKPGA